MTAIPTFRAAGNRTHALTQRLRDAVRTYRIRRAHETLWTGASSIDELRDLMARFCLGDLVCWPGHLGPRDPETTPIGEQLAHANRAGFLTTCSQPGCGPDDVDADHPFAPATWEQRAAVQGLCDQKMLQRLAAVIAGTRLRIQSTTADGVRRTDYRTAVAVTLVNGEHYTGFGATCSARDLAFDWAGVHDNLIDDLIGMQQVTLYDPAWGPEGLLWERLAQL